LLRMLVRSSFFLCKSFFFIFSETHEVRLPAVRPDICRNTPFAI